MLSQGPGSRLFAVHRVRDNEVAGANLLPTTKGFRAKKGRRDIMHEGERDGRNGKILTDT